MFNTFWFTHMYEKVIFFDLVYFPTRMNQKQKENIANKLVPTSTFTQYVCEWIEEAYLTEEIKLIWMKVCR